MGNQPGTKPGGYLMRQGITLIAFGLLCIGCVKQTAPPERRVAITQPDQKDAGRGTSGKDKDRESGKPIHTDWKARCVAFSPDGKRVAVGYSTSPRFPGPHLKIWDIETREEAESWACRPYPIELELRKLPPPPPPERTYHRV